MGTEREVIKDNTLWIILGVAIGLCSVIVGVFMYFVWWQGGIPYSTDPEAWAYFATYFGNMATPILTVGAVGIAYYQLNDQIKQREKAREDEEKNKYQKDKLNEYRGLLEYCRKDAELVTTLLMNSEKDLNSSLKSKSIHHITYCLRLGGAKNEELKVVYKTILKLSGYIYLAESTLRELKHIKSLTAEIIKTLDGNHSQEIKDSIHNIFLDSTSLEKKIDFSTKYIIADFKELSEEMDQDRSEIIRFNEAIGHIEKHITL